MKKDNESYDAVIKKLLAERAKKGLSKALVEGYRGVGREEMEILREWETASNEV